jgi:hypothetical protein
MLTRFGRLLLNCLNIFLGYQSPKQVGTEQCNAYPFSKGWFGKNPRSIRCSILSLTIRDWTQQNPGSSSGFIKALKYRNNICTGCACYSSTSGCNAPCPREHSFRDTTHTVLPKLNAWPETTIAQRNTEGHQSRSNNKRPKTKLHHTDVSKSEKSSTISQWIIVDSCIS